MDEFDTRVREIGRRTLEHKLRKALFWALIGIMAYFALTVMGGI